MGSKATLVQSDAKHREFQTWYGKIGTNPISVSADNGGVPPYRTVTVLGSTWTQLVIWEIPGSNA